MELLYKLLKEFEKEYNLDLCVIINNHIIYGADINKSVNIPFINNNKKSLLMFDKEVDELSIKYLISVINNVYNGQNEDELLEKLFTGKLNEDETKQLSNYISDKRWCLSKIYFSGEISLENVVNNIFDCKYIFINYDNKSYLLIEEEISDNKLLLSLKDTIESEMYLEVRMLYSDGLNGLESIKKAYDKLNMLDDIFINHSNYKIASDKDFKLETMIDRVDSKTLEDILSNITSASFDELDAELLNTIDIFLRNNLSISNTAKELYIHRNTLIYRLDKIKQLTNLDIRIFEDAFWMVIAKAIYRKIK